MVIYSYRHLYWVIIFAELFLMRYPICTTCINTRKFIVIIPKTIGKRNATIHSFQISIPMNCCFFFNYPFYAYGPSIIVRVPYCVMKNIAHHPSTQQWYFIFINFPRNKEKQQEKIINDCHVIPQGIENEEQAFTKYWRRYIYMVFLLDSPPLLLVNVLC